MASHQRVKGKGGGKRTTERKRNLLHPPLFQLEVVVDAEGVIADCFSWKEVKQDPDLDGVKFGIICDTGMDPLEAVSLGKDFTYEENSDWLPEARVVRKVKGKQNVDTIFDILNQINVLAPEWTD
ncbi:hypothetical protein HDU67_008723 [Dinochytrium kinnereticum]|nr:hypothetical protein HDU67_008723 [Dinochytrium kinnereticum]